MQSITLSALSVILPGFDAFEFLYLRNRERYSFPEFMEDKKAWMKRALWLHKLIKKMRQKGFALDNERTFLPV